MSCKRVKVKYKESVVIDWERPMLGELTLEYQGERVIIEKSNFWGGRETYTTTYEESVHTVNDGWRLF